MSVDIRPTGAMGEYTVDVGGVRVGRVMKVEQHFNLRRPVTVRYWRAYPVGGPPVPDHFRLRGDAVAALTGGR